MKKILQLSLLFTTFITNGQILVNENFNALTIGNLNTIIDGSTVGQAGWFTIATNGSAPTTTNNASVSNFQIVTIGNNGSQGFLLQTPNGDKGNRRVWQEGLPALWTSRDVGKDIIEVEYDLFTGPVTGNVANVDVLLRANNGGNAVIPIGMRYMPATRIFTGLAYLNFGGTFLFTSISWGLAPFEPNTWYRVGFSYNTSTGEVIWKGPDGILSTAALIESSNWVPNSTPTEFNYNVSVPTTGFINNTTSNIIFDNLVVRAVATSTLSLDNVQNVDNTISLYPNPANSNLNIYSKDNILNIKILDINGRIIYDKNNLNSNTSNIEVSNLKAGIYMVIVENESGVQKSKFIKS